MKIDILTGVGSSDGITMKSLYGTDGHIGVGGSEYALLTMCEEWTKQGYQVRLYNNPIERNASPFEQLAFTSFNRSEDRDVLIVFRVPNSIITQCKGYKVWWSCDQYTQGSYTEFAPLVDKIVCISPFHRQHFASEYKIHDTVSIDLPVRYAEYARLNWNDKVKGRCIFLSVPDRGLLHLSRIWDIVIREVPWASLVVTSDYRLWGLDNPGNERFRALFYKRSGVMFMGALRRNELVQEQLLSQLLVYPCSYEELFCIAAAEAQIAGVYPITSALGALRTTNMGLVVDMGFAMREDNPHKDYVDFASYVINKLTSENLLDYQKEVQDLALVRFHPNTILKQWEDKVFKHG